jgi:hypothetical protein
MYQRTEEYGSEDEHCSFWEHHNTTFESREEDEFQFHVSPSYSQALEEERSIMKHEEEKMIKDSSSVLMMSECHGSVETTVPNDTDQEQTDGEMSAISIVSKMLSEMVSFVDKSETLKPVILASSSVAEPVEIFHEIDESIEEDMVSVTSRASEESGAPSDDGRRAKGRDELELDVFSARFATLPSENQGPGMKWIKFDETKPEEVVARKYNISISQRVFASLDEKGLIHNDVSVKPICSRIFLSSFVMCH